MGKTLRWFMNKFNIDYNPFWSKHEYKVIRADIHRAFRHENKANLIKGRDVEKESKTRGWITW